jgi:SAM-dependent methyltransferase
MTDQFSERDRQRIAQGIHKRYAHVAATAPEGQFRYPTGRAGIEGLKYDPRIVGAFPDDVLASYCGVGNPFPLGEIKAGDFVLDIGCGAGVDTLISAMLAGSTGKAVGIDLVPEMVEKAKQSLARTALQNVEFHEASAERLSFPDRTFDVVISNGVINLIPDKRKALAEIFRVLKPAGRLMVADQVRVGERPANTTSLVEKWAG